jgi:hypothetical protein
LRRVVTANEGSTIDAAEDAQFGPDFRVDELPKELQNRKTRKVKIRAAIKVLKEEQSKLLNARSRTGSRRMGPRLGVHQLAQNEPEDGLDLSAGGRVEPPRQLTSPLRSPGPDAESTTPPKNLPNPGMPRG